MVGIGGVGDPEQIGGSTVCKNETCLRIEHDDRVARGVERSNQLVVQSIVAHECGHVVRGSDITDGVSVGVAHRMRSERDDHVGAVGAGHPEVRNKTRVRRSRGNPLRLQFGASARHGMRPRSNAEGERRTTQREDSKCVVGRGQPTIKIGLAQGDRKRGERAVDASSLTETFARMRERASRLGGLHVEGALGEVEGAHLHGGEERIAIDGAVGVGDSRDIERLIEREHGQ